MNNALRMLAQWGGSPVQWDKSKMYYVMKEVSTLPSSLAYLYIQIEREERAPGFVVCAMPPLPMNSFNA